MLEVGGGIGAFEIELPREGATRATNVELTPTYEEAAGELLHEAGSLDRVDRRVGDFVDADLDAADLVILNRVVCGYPNMPRLAAAAAKHAGSTLILTFPNDRWLTRIGLTLVNFGFRVVRVQFQVFLHPPDGILAAVEDNGLRAQLNHRGLVWQTAALEGAG